MTYADEVWFFLLTPGERHCIVGSSCRITKKLETQQDEEAMAKEFDVKLEERVSRGMASFQVVSHREIRLIGSIDSSIQFGIFTVHAC